MTPVTKLASALVRSTLVRVSCTESAAAAARAAAEPQRAAHAKAVDTFVRAQDAWQARRAAYRARPGEVNLGVAARLAYLAVCDARAAVTATAAALAEPRR